MPTTIYPGTAAYVELPQGEYTFDSWALTLTSDKADVSDYDRIASRFLPGATFGAVTLGGPFSTNDGASPQGLGMISGSSYDVTLGLTDAVGVVVNVQVEVSRIVVDVHGVARVEVAGVVNNDFLIDPDVVFLFDDALV